MSAGGTTPVDAEFRSEQGFGRVAAMCFDLDSSPPIPRIAGAAVSHEDLILTAADGNRLAAFLERHQADPGDQR